MVNRLGQLAGGLLLILVIARLGRLIQLGSDLPRWVPILIAATILGAVVQWLLYSTRMPALLGGLIMALGGVAIFLRVTVPATLIYGVIPTAETLPALSAELETASRMIRFGIPPVLPEPGLIGVLALLMWSLGAVYILGVLYNRLALMVLPAAIVYLQFAVFDRVHAGLGWMVASALVLVLAFAGLSFQRRHQVGAVRDDAGRAQALRSSAAPLIMAGIVAFFSVMGANQASAMVSEYGNVPWRGWGGGGGVGGGGILFNRFVDLRQSLLSRENAVLFRATLGPDSPPGASLYWRLETLDFFDGEAWIRGNSQSTTYRPGLEIGQPAQRYQGTVSEVLQRIYLERLAGDVLPAAGVPSVLHQLDDPDSLNTRSIRTGVDGALLLHQGLRADANYQLIADYPRHDLDLGGLATGSNGELSPIFASAAAEGSFTAVPSSAHLERDPVTPNNLSSFTQVPTDTPPALAALARTVTRGATTDFERAWMLEHWLRVGGNFNYSTSVTTGHSSLNLQDWLLTPTSPNYRTGYCEQFAATMALLARLVGVPSRVVMGFTPGTVSTVDGVEVVEVRDTNAHAWVEIWIRGFGWVKFDPTPGGTVNTSTFTPSFDPARFVPPPPVNPGDLPIDENVEIPEGPFEQPGAPVGPTERPREVPRWPLYVIATGLVVGFIPFMKRMRRNARVERLRNGDITAAWEEIVDRLSDMGEPIQEELTPLEFAASTSKELVPLARSYSAAIYGGRNGAGRSDDLEAAELWIEMAFDRSERLKGTFNPKSLVKRR